MGKTSLLFAFSLSLFFSACAQQNKNQLLDEVSTLLKKKEAKPSDILTSNKYQQLHPQNDFRELIREHADTEALKISTPDEPGKKIRILAKIVDKNGNPVADALVYMYQTDSKGWYSASSPHVGGNSGDVRQARLFGYVRTDNEGRFELHTVKPSGYPQSDLPAHIHVHIWKEGYSNFVNEFLFDDDDRLVGETRKNSERYNLMIAKPETATKPFDQQFSYLVILSK
jgi:protocatechuate 3,4-dioxygenase beta subunit